MSFSERQSICYICEFANLPGQFLLDKAVKLGVTEESFNELAIGNPVLSSYGRKVDPSEVLSLSTPGQVFMIVDCPSVEIRDHLVHSSEFSQFYSSSGSKTPHVIIHLTPFEIFESESYKMWMDEFGKDTTHIVINKQVVNQGMTGLFFWTVVREHTLNYIVCTRNTQQMLWLPFDVCSYHIVIQIITWD